MARYRIVPERSKVFIDARSSLHPIDTAPTGLEGLLDLEVQGGGRVDLDGAADGPRSTSRSSKLCVGQPARGPRAPDAASTPAASRPSSGELTTMNETGTDGRYLVRRRRHVQGRDPHATRTRWRCRRTIDPRTLAADRGVDLRHPGLRHGPAAHPDAEGRARGRGAGRDRRRAGGLTHVPRHPRTGDRAARGARAPRAGRRERRGSGREHRAAGGRGPRSRATGCSSTSASRCRRSTRRRRGWPWRGSSCWAASYDDELEALRAVEDHRPRTGGTSLMRFVDEYRDPAAARGARRPHHRGRRRRPLQVHGGVRRPHAHHLPARDRARAARTRRAGARARLPGVRDPDGSGRRRHRGGARPPA